MVRSHKKHPGGTGSSRTTKQRRNLKKKAKFKRERKIVARDR